MSRPLQYAVKSRPRRLRGTFGVQLKPEGGPQNRLKRLQMVVTDLVRHERIETTCNKADEARGYAEQLIYMAIKNGDRHQETMKTADFWLLEKDLVHKLFKVLVPRYQNYKSSYTQQFRLPTEYPGIGNPLAVLELKENPYPPVLPQPRDRKHLLHNVLIAAASQRRREKQLGVTGPDAEKQKQAVDSLSETQSQLSEKQETEDQSLNSSSRQQQQIDSEETLKLVEEKLGDLVVEQIPSKKSEQS